jgi:uncharacterized protein (TIGR02996 family)
MGNTMSDRAALYAAVCANPDDDTPRLVFADWLQEHGEEKRAAFIRAEVENHNRQNADTPAATVWRFFKDCNFDDLGNIDWSQVAAELGELQAAERAAKKSRYSLKKKSEGLPRVKGVEFREVERGFYSAVWVKNTESFVKNLDAIFRAAPITHIDFRSEDLTEEHAREFVDSGHLAQVRSLGFIEGCAPEALRVIGGHRDAGGVSLLEVWADADASNQLTALAAGKHWTGLTRLEVMDFDDVDDPQEAASGFAEMIRRPQFRKLRRIDAWGNDLDSQVARAIAKAGLTELRHLDLAFNSIGEDGAKAIATSKSLSNLRYLDIASCDLGIDSAAALITSRKLPNLAVLKLDNNSRDGASLSAAASVLTSANRNPTLRVLSLDDVPLAVSVLAALGKCASIQGLWFLSFNGSGVRDHELAAFTNGLPFGQLVAFDLENNNLTAPGMQTLAEWPGCASLQSVDISGNQPGEAGAKALIQSEHLKKLKRMNVTGLGTARLRKHFGKKVVP